MSVFYKFTTSGIGNVIVGRLFPFKTTGQIASESGESHFKTEKTKMPLVGAYYDTSLILKTRDGEQIIIPEAAATVVKKKIIVKTPLVSGNGTIKEYISEKDIELTIIVGIVAIDDEKNIIDAYPEDEIKKLRKILDRKESINIVSPFLSLFEIDGGSLNVVIEEYKVTQQTAYNREVFTITAVSDYDHTLYADEN